MFTSYPVQPELVWKSSGAKADIAILNWWVFSTFPSAVAALLTLVAAYK
jgi:hypothetical protein